MHLAACILVSILATNAVDLADALVAERIGCRFDLVGTIAFTPQADEWEIQLSDSTGGVGLIKPEDMQNGFLSAGDKVRVRGTISRNRNEICCANCQSVTLLGHGAKPIPIPIGPADLNTRDVDGKTVIVEGQVKDVFVDEIAPNWIYASLNCQGTPVYVVLRDPHHVHRQKMQALVDCDVSVTCTCNAHSDGVRRIIGKVMRISSPADFKVLRRPPADAFAVPEISDQTPRNPMAVNSLGKRRITGKTIAVWGTANAILVDEHGYTHFIRCSGAAPSYGDVVDAVGTSETDFFRINLAGVIWRKSNRTIAHDETPRDMTIPELFLDKNRMPCIHPTIHGKVIRLTGVVTDMPARSNLAGDIMLNDVGYSIPVDTSATPSALDGLSVGCKVSIAGTCVVETENWRPYMAFPHVSSVKLIVRTPADVLIVSRPPWWTKEKLLCLVSSLVLVILVFFVWNRWLNRLVARRSRALVKEQLALAEAELKVGERTRLAIELHDSLSQNLAAVACQVSATKSAVKVSADETLGNLNVVERMLLSCRTELRRCLWDLRNDAFDERNMTDVIRKVLAPVLGKAELQVRFNVSRARLDDSILHSVICVIRELTANAVVHGRATHVSVAGDLDGDTLAFSVSENGRGFDSALCDGPAEGHFGLVGIRERVDRLCGTFLIESQPGKGSYAKIAFRLPSNDVED